MKKYLLLCLLIAVNAYADVAYNQKTPVVSENGILTSQEYVNDRIDRNQDKIQPLPAGTTVDKIVVDPATSGGVPGARDIVTDISTGASDGVPTSDAVYTAKETRNAKIWAFNNQNIVTYTGTTSANSNGPGQLTTTPIYSKEINTYKNGLVRASTLNEAVQFARDHELTRVDTPRGALWSVTGPTVPAPLPVTANLPAYVARDHNYAYCYKPITLNDTQAGRRGGCTESRWGANVGTPNEYSQAGDWGAVFPYETGIAADGVVCTGANSENCNKEIRGISAVVSNTFSGMTTYAPVPSSLWATLDAAYENHKNGEPVADDARRCYCKLTNPAVVGTNGAASRWVYRGVYNGTQCAAECAWALGYYPDFSATMFGAYTE